MSVIKLVLAILSVLAGFCALIYVWFQHKYKYWLRRGVKGPKPTIPSGHFLEVFLKRQHISEPISDEYEEYKHLPYFGMYSLHRPVLIVNDLELIKNILIRDFSHFDSHGVLVNEKVDPMSGHLFNLSGKDWKEMRVKLSPTFTTGKMKLMYGIMLEVANEFEKHVNQLTLDQDEFNFKDLFAQFTTENIGNCAFGIECGNFDNPNSEFRKYSKEGVAPTTPIEQFTSVMTFLIPSVVKRLGLRSQSPEMVEFFTTMVQQTLEYRERHEVVRNDLMQLLIQLKNDNLLNDNGNPININGKEGLTLTQIVAQAFVFFIAGFETSSAAASFALYELAKNTAIQDKVRQDILESMEKHGGKLTYEALTEMNYLNMVIEETLRFYPAMKILFRECTKTYPMPKSDLTVEKGTLVFIPIGSIQKDANYFPEPEKFDPDRFLPENKVKRHMCTYMPFAKGPRMCLGMRFGIMQTKMALIKILTNYEVMPCSRTPFPVGIDPVNTSTVSPKGGMWLKVSKLEKQLFYRRIEYSLRIIKWT